MVCFFISLPTAAAMRPLLIPRLIAGLSLILAVSADISDFSAVSAIDGNFHLSSMGLNSSDYCSWTRIRCSDAWVELLDLSHLSLTGVNLSLISELRSLKWLDLSYNSFHEPIPPSLSNLSQLEFLDLSGNKFSALIPPELGNLRNLRSLNLSNNQLEGSIPDDLRNLSRLAELQLSSNRITGSVPIWLASMTGLRVFTAYENSLQGHIPQTLGSISQPTLLNLHSNQLEGLIPETIFSSGTMRVLILTKNRLTGPIPDSIGRCRFLSSVRLGFNSLNGTLPRSIKNITSLTYFEANNNGFSGELILEFSNCPNLSLLNLASNRLTGRVPLFFSRLQNLQELILSGNALTGEIPQTPNSLTKLELSGNRFNSTVPADICSPSRLQYLLLSENSMTGEIPTTIGDCMKLLELNLGGNRLEGRIPTELGRLRNLQIALNLSSNNLEGHLPPALGNLDKLVSLDVSDNHLSGAIPPELEGMESLIQFDFSDNLFTGTVPDFAPFRKTPGLGFSGNRDLCWEPPCAGPHRVSGKAVAALIASSLGAFAVVTSVVLLFMLRERRADSSKVNAPPAALSGSVFVDGLQHEIDYGAVVRSATKEENVVSVGTFSTAYRSVMPSGFTLSVRRLRYLDRSAVQYRKKMVRELERLSRVCTHDHLVRPIGYVICEEDNVLLLHHHYPGGTLSRLLQGGDGHEWPLRLRIAAGIADGLAHLHHSDILHMDVSSANVVLDAALLPMLGEIEISRLVDPSKGTAASISAVAGSFGYIPPEYAYTMQVTTAGNVYSYGVILLEILTSRKPVDEAFGEGIDLVKWVHGAPARRETPEQILDPRLSTVSFRSRKEMLAALRVALACTDRAPAKRPRMKKVVELLSEIKCDNS